MTPPPPLELFRKFIRFGRGRRPLDFTYMYMIYLVLNSFLLMYARNVIILNIYLISIPFPTLHRSSPITFLHNSHHWSLNRSRALGAPHTSLTSPRTFPPCRPEILFSVGLYIVDPCVTHVTHYWPMCLCSSVFRLRRQGFMIQVQYKNFQKDSYMIT